MMRLHIAHQVRASSGRVIVRLSVGLGSLEVVREAYYQFLTSSSKQLCDLHPDLDIQRSAVVVAADQHLQQSSRRLWKGLENHLSITVTYFVVVQ